MNIDIRTLAVVLGITSVLQVFAFLLQYLVNKTYRGIGWWALGYALAAVGFVLLLLRDVVTVALISIILPNLLLVLGSIIIYIGTTRFFGNKGHGGVVLSIFAAFILSFFYYTYVQNDITARTVIVTAVGAIISFMTALGIFRNRVAPFFASVYFTSVVFFAFGCFSAFRALMTLTLSPVRSLFTPSLMQTSGLLVPLVLGILSTFGLIIMVNQRLNAEMKEAKEQFEVIFNTSPDASLVTRLDDGVIVNVNERFTEVSGFSRNEIIGKSSLGTDMWVNPSDRQKLVDELKEKGYCLNYEATFQIDGGNQITGMTSAKIITLNNIRHVISITRDITERKRAEEALRESENRLRAIFESAEEGIIAVDEEQRCLEANPASGVITGVPHDQLVGRFLREFVDPSFDLSAAWEGFLRAGKFQGQVRIRHSNGSLRILDVSGVADMGPGRHLLVGHDITERKLAEETLKESEERFRVMADGTPVMIWATDEAGQMGFVNQAYLDFFGSDLEAVQSVGWKPLVHPDDLNAYAEEYSHCLAQRKPFHALARVRRYDGEWRWVESYAQPRFSLSGEFLGMVGSSPDITDRKKAEQVLSDSERRHRELAAVLEEERGKLKTIIDNLPVGLWIADAGGKMIVINDNARSVWGGTAPYAHNVDGYEVYKAWWADTGKPITAEDMPMARSLRGEVCRNMTIDFERFDGRRGTQLVSSAPIRSSDDTIVGSIAIVQDITEHKRAEEALKASEERYRHLVKYAPTGIYEVDLVNKRFKSVNEVMCQVLGYTEEELLCMDPSVLLDEDGKKAFAEKIRKSLAGEELNETEYRIIPKNGHEFWAVLNMAFTYEEGRATGALVVAYDVTERKKAEDLLRMREAQLAEVNQIMSGILEQTRESREDLNRAQAVAHTGSWRLDVGRNEFTWSDETYRLFSIPEGTPLTYEKFLSFVHPEDREYVDREWCAAMRGEPYQIEHRIVVGDTVKWVGEKAELEFDKEGLLIGGFGTVQDITERKQAEANRALLTDTLQILNRGGDLHPLVAETLRMIQDATGFDAVGLRLRVGEDCPYFEHNGFSAEFLRDENSLCAKSHDGKIEYDAEGRVVLECTCGLILSGLTDPSMSCFTDGGSFWTNASSEMLTLPLETDPRTNPRNRCIHAGYESVGLFPVRSAREIIGLLQLNGRRAGRFTPELVAFYETLAQNIGLALQRTMAEESLRESKEKYRNLYDEAPVGYIELDSEGRVDRVNRKILEMVGYSAEEMIGEHMWNFVVEKDEAEEAIRAKLSGYERPSEGLERTYKRKDGPPIPVLIKDRVARNSEGSVTRIRMTVQDITERKQMEKELRRSRDELELRVRERTAELERKNRELQEFAYVASHDLSEPLRKIQTFGDVLTAKSADRLNEQERDYLSRMTGAASRMQELLDALLRYSRVETRKEEFRPVRLNDVVKDAANDLEIAIRNAGVQVEIGPLPIIKGDPYQWRQVFQNLIANAAKYHRSEVKPSIKIYGEEIDGAYNVFVEDNGIGFDEKYLDKIFQPFQRLHGKHEYQGTGIGLAICKKIVERHGGTITARSTPGKGSTFIVTLPLKKPS